MNLIKKIISTSLVVSILFLVFGLLLFFKPEGTINAISGIIGVTLLIMGIFSIVKYVKDKQMIMKFDLVYGIVSVVAGLVLLFNPNAVASILPFILGVYFVINGAMKINTIIDIKKRTGYFSISSLVIAILIVVCGVMFIFNPFEGALAITKIIGVFLIIYSILDIVNYMSLRKGIKEVEYIIKD